MARCSQHAFQVVKKRAKRMREHGEAMERGATSTKTVIQDIRRDHPLRLEVDVSGAGIAPLPNVWLGVSAEDQERADERIPDLLDTPAAIRFVSLEPLLGPID